MDTIYEFNVYSTVGVVMLLNKRDIFLSSDSCLGYITDMILIILRVAVNLNQLNFCI